MKKLNDYEQKLLRGWEDVHNKGQLSLWILLALKDNPKHMERIKAFIADATNSLVNPDDKSIYRALRRFRDTELVDFELHPSPSGPDLKIYDLTVTGKSVLRSFAERNIINILYQPKIRKLIEKG